MTKIITDAISCVIMNTGIQEAEKAKLRRLTALASAKSLFQSAASYLPLCGAVPSDLVFLGEKIILGE